MSEWVPVSSVVEPSDDLWLALVDGKVRVVFKDETGRWRVIRSHQNYINPTHLMRIPEFLP